MNVAVDDYLSGFLAATRMIEGIAAVFVDGENIDCVFRVLPPSTDNAFNAGQSDNILIGRNCIVTAAACEGCHCQYCQTADGRSEKRPFHCITSRIGSYSSYYNTLFTKKTVSFRYTVLEIH